MLGGGGIGRGWGGGGGSGGVRCDRNQLMLSPTPQQYQVYQHRGQLLIMQAYCTARFPSFLEPGRSYINPSGGGDTVVATHLVEVTPCTLLESFGGFHCI